MSPQHHLGEDLLLTWATGEGCEATRLLCAAHMTLCPTCRSRAESMEALGGQLFEKLAPAALKEDALEAMFRQVEGNPDSPPPTAPPTELDTSWVLPNELPLPRPIQQYLRKEDQWKSILGGRVQMLELPLSLGSQPMKLTRVSPGFKVPQHTHEGLEFNLVLSGGFHDGDVDFRRGDIAINDDSVEHHLTIDEGEDCVFLAAAENPLKPVGFKATIMSWLAGGF
jgi:putative transcriptional regulator